jgi:hypothetical protein
MAILELLILELAIRNSGWLIKLANLVFHLEPTAMNLPLNRNVFMFMI